MFKSILVPIDVAHESSWQFALPEAIELAKAGGKKIVIMTVVREMTALFEGVYFPYQLEKMMTDAEEKLTKLVAKYQASDISIEHEVRFGSIGHEILASARDHNTDVIVMASHRPEMRDYLIGPNAAHVAQNASCSVLVLRRFA